MPPRVGELVCGDLQLERELALGTGSPVFGRTQAARRPAPIGPCWVTWVDAGLVPTSVHIAKFLAEVYPALELRHPALLRTIFVDREAEDCVVGFEALGGAASLGAGGRPLGPEALLRCARDLARGLAFLHKQKIVCGLVAPSTVLAWEDGFLLWQYGLAGACDRDAVRARARKLMGPLIAPELLDGSPISPVVDVYGVGATLAVLAAPDDPVGALEAALRGQAEAVPPQLAEVVLRALDGDPALRPADGAALLGALDRAHERSASTRRSAVPPRPPSPEPRRADEEEVSVEAVLIEEAPRPRARRARAQAQPEERLDSLIERDVGEVPVVGRALPSRRGEEDLDRALLELPSVALPAAASPVPTPPPEPPRAVAAPAVAPMAEVVKRRPRSPGPHGPRAALMAATVGLIAPLVVALSLLHVASSRGGLSRLWKPLPEPRAAVAAALPPAGVAPPGPASVEPEPVAAAPEALPAKAVPPPPSPACPADTATLGPHACIERFEFPGRGRVPRTGVTLQQAQAACEERGRRLCGRREWQSACRGRGRRYPYGAGYVPDRCNTASIAGFPQEVGLAGAYADCATAEGVHDLVGNVGEWLADGTAVGGDSRTEGAAATCLAHGRPPPGYAGPELGFRCCIDRGS